MGREGVAICAPLPHEPSRRHRAGQLRAVCCVALGGSGRAGRRSLVPASGGQENGQTAHQRAGLRATGWNAGQWPGGSGRADGRTPGPVPGGQENSQQTHERAGCLAEAGQLQGGALRLPGWLCGYLCVQLGHNQRPAQCFKSAHVCGFWALLAERVGGHLVPAPGCHLDVQTAYQRAGQKAAGPDAWQGVDASRVARYTSLGGPGRVDGRAPGHGSRRSGGRLDGPTVGRQRATGRTLGRSQAAPARRAALPWVALAIINPIFTVLIL